MKFVLTKKCCQNIYIYIYTYIHKKIVGNIFKQASANLRHHESDIRMKLNYPLNKFCVTSSSWLLKTFCLSLLRSQVFTVIELESSGKKSKVNKKVNKLI